MADLLSAALTRRLEVAVQCAREAGQFTLQYFQTEVLQVERKSDDSPVTIADRGAEQLLRDRIAAQFPGDAIIGEELGEVAGTSGFRWILDPIDGTKSFISGVPLYSQLIGVEQDGRGMIGVIALPALGEMVYAARGQGTWHVRGQHAPRQVHVSNRTLDKGLFVTSQVDSFDKRGAADAYHQLQQLAYVTRTWGDGYGYFLVATGRAEVMVDPVMNVWDAAAVQPVVEEAGGTFTDWRGDSTIRGGEGISTNGVVLPQVLDITRRFVPSR